MNPWPFVAAAYTLAVTATAALLLASFIAMRRAERRAQAIRDRRR